MLSVQQLTACQLTCIVGSWCCLVSECSAVDSLLTGLRCWQLVLSGVECSAVDSLSTDLRCWQLVLSSVECSAVDSLSTDLRCWQLVLSHV